MASDRFSRIRTKYNNINQDERKERKDLRFPLDYGKHSDQWIVFDEYTYGRPSADDGFKPISTGKSIALPIPGNLETFYNASWNDENLGFTGDYISQKMAQLPEAASMAATAGQEFYDNPSKFLKSHVDSLKKGFGVGGEILDIGSKFGIDAISASEAFKRVGVYSGKLRNPYTAAIFSGVSFRQFSFDYKFFPKSFEESETLRNIIYAFKYAMHPSITKTYEDNLFDYPNIYKIYFTQPEFLFDFGYCVLRDFRVNYHGENIPVYHNKDGVKIPASIMMTIGLMEIELNTKESIEKEGR